MIQSAFQLPVEPPQRLSLGRFPTPLDASPRLGRELGIDLRWKRDDLSGIELSGNKVRKLEFLLADAEAQGADTVLTCGGVQSNHCRATAFAAAARGLRCLLLLRVADPAAPPPLEANTLLARLAGADLRYISFAEYRGRQDVLRRVAAELAAAGRRPYVITEGGSSALGAWGYLLATAELLAQVPPAWRGQPVRIIYATGSGGTGAGVEIAVRLLGWNEARPLGVAACNDRRYFQEVIAAISMEASRRWPGLPAVPAEEVEIDDRFIGPGYARATPEVLALIARVARADGIALDPVYTGKAFLGLESRLREGQLGRDEHVVFLHTGGLFGLFPFASGIARAIGSLEG